jgi:hypothetical protein
MAALPTPIDPLPQLSLVPPLTETSHDSASAAVSDAVRPRFRRLVVFTGKIT